MYQYAYSLGIEPLILVLICSNTCATETFCHLPVIHALKRQQYIKLICWSNPLDCSPKQHSKVWHNGSRKELKFVFMGLGGQIKGAYYEASCRTMTMNTHVCTCKGYNTSWAAAVFGVCLLFYHRQLANKRWRFPPWCTPGYLQMKRNRGMNWCVYGHKYGWEQSSANCIQETNILCVHLKWSMYL